MPIKLNLLKLLSAPSAPLFATLQVISGEQGVFLLNPNKWDISAGFCAIFWRSRKNWIKFLLFLWIVKILFLSFQIFTHLWIKINTLFFLNVFLFQLFLQSLAFCNFSQIFKLQRNGRLRADIPGIEFEDELFGVDYSTLAHNNPLRAIASHFQCLLRPINCVWVFGARRQEWKWYTINFNKALIPIVGT